MQTMQIKWEMSIGKIERLEADMKTARLDREMGIDMRADLRILRQYMDDIIRKLTANAGALPNGAHPLTKDRP